MAAWDETSAASQIRQLFKLKNGKVLLVSHSDIAVPLGMPVKMSPAKKGQLGNSKGEQ